MSELLSSFFFNCSLTTTCLVLPFAHVSVSSPGCSLSLWHLYDFSCCYCDLVIIKRDWVKKLAVKLHFADVLQVSLLLVCQGHSTVKQSQLLSYLLWPLFIVTQNSSLNFLYLSQLLISVSAAGILVNGTLFKLLLNMPLSLRTKNLSDHCLADPKRLIVGQR